MLIPQHYDGLVNYFIFVHVGWFSPVQGALERLRSGMGYLGAQGKPPDLPGNDR